MARHFAVLIAFGVLVAAPALARDKTRPITRREPDVIDVAKTPMTDLNLSRTEIPALLVEAQKRPYSDQGLDSCAKVAAAVAELDTVLGPDIDLPQSERARFSKGRLAQWAVGTFIPFRSLIREFSGANRQQREIADAIQAGLARRGFLKGVGSTRNCPYPASPATESIIAQHAAASEKDERAKPGTGAGSARVSSDAAGIKGAAAPSVPAARPKPVFTAEPVVQPTR
jgi:hypothetical protein